MANTPNTIKISIIDKIQPQNIPYSEHDNEVRLEYFMQMYQNLGGLVEIPETEGTQLDFCERFLQQSIHDAVSSAMNGLVALIDILCEKIDKEKPVDGTT